MSDTPKSEYIAKRLEKSSVEVGDPDLGVQMRMAASGLREFERENAELLAALEAIEKHVTGMGGIDRVDLLAICAHVKRDARAAIAQASGR